MFSRVAPLCILVQRSLHLNRLTQAIYATLIVHIRSYPEAVIVMPRFDLRCSFEVRHSVVKTIWRNCAVRWQQLNLVCWLPSRHCVRLRYDRHDLFIDWFDNNSAQIFEILLYIECIANECPKLGAHTCGWARRRSGSEVLHGREILQTE